MHVDHIAMKIYAGLGDFKKVRTFVPREIYNLKIVVSAGLHVNKGLSERIDKSHNRAARIISRSD